MVEIQLAQIFTISIGSIGTGFFSRPVTWYHQGMIGQNSTCLDLFASARGLARYNKRSMESWRNQGTSAQKVFIWARLMSSLNSADIDFAQPLAMIASTPAPGTFTCEQASKQHPAYQRALVLESTIKCKLASVRVGRPCACTFCNSTEHACAWVVYIEGTPPRISSMRNLWSIHTLAPASHRV